jgi:hypothetical protein
MNQLGSIWKNCRVLYTLLLALFVLSACDTQRQEGAPSDQEVIVVASQALIPRCNGLAALLDSVVYYDLSTSKFYICNRGTLVTLNAVGQPGMDGTSWLAVSSPAASDDCPSGGISLQLGPDENGDGTLGASEIASTANVCNGRDGVDGADGMDGEDGLDGADGSSCTVMENDDGTKTIACADGTRVTVRDGADGRELIIAPREEAPGSLCAAGGRALSWGYDDDGDGALDPDEIDYTEVLCNGADGVDGVDGTDGNSSLVSVATEDAGANCASGGAAIFTGIDANDDEVLDPSEIRSTIFVCNGPDGANGEDGSSALVRQADESAGTNCAHGGVRIESGLDDDDDGSLDDMEVEHTSYACNGAPGGDDAGALTALSVSSSLGGTVVSSPPGVYCGASCAASFPEGSTVTLTAVPGPGGAFAGWGGGICTGVGPCVIELSGATSVSATFNSPLLVSRTGTGQGNVTSTPAGISCGPQCTATYAPGALVTLSAAPSSNSTFAGWSGACSGLGSCAVTVEGAQSVTATFMRAQASVHVLKDGAGDGIVTSTPSGISCGPACEADFDLGSNVVLSAVAAENSSFAGWSGACTGTGPCSLTIDSAKSVRATFSRPFYTLTTSTQPALGTLVSSPTGVYCGAACSAEYLAGTLVTLTPVPNSGVSFGDWSGACTGTVPSCNVSLTSHKTVNARFGYLLTVNRVGGGGGTVTSTVAPGGSPGAINCGSNCSAVFNPSSVVTLTATPNANGTFLGWSGSGCSGTGSCVVTMNQASSVTAAFSFPVNVTRYNNGGGTVGSVPAGIDCGTGGACSNSFLYGTVVRLTAIPAPSAEFFDEWTGCDSIDSSGNACTVTVNGAEHLQAKFRYPLTVTRTTATMGAVTGPNGMNCGSTCTVSYGYNDQVTVTANPDVAQGYSFGSWQHCDQPSGSTCTMTMSTAKTVNAIFSRP